MSRLARFRSLLAILLAVGVLGACSRNSEPRNGPEVGEMRDARVDVSNFNWLDMAIYAVRGGMRVRLGTVTSMNRERFTIPPNLMITDGVQLVASPIGSNVDYATHPINIWPGDTVEFRIENNIGTSTTTTW